MEPYVQFNLPHFLPTKIHKMFFSLSKRRRQQTGRYISSVLLQGLQQVSGEWKVPNKLILINTLHVFFAQLRNDQKHPLHLRHNGRLKSPALWLFTQPFIQTQIKENITYPRNSGSKRGKHILQQKCRLVIVYGAFTTWIETNKYIYDTVT